MNTVKNWPNFFIVGAPRCGTTSLYEYVNQTQGVFMCPIKEPNHFSVNVNPNTKLSKLIRNETEYLELFKEVKDEIAIGEASPTYLWDPKAGQLIHDANPDARIIMMLRDPVARAYSHYLLLVGLGFETSTFEDSIKKALDAKPDYSGSILETGLYYEQVKKYYEIFDRKQIKIIIFEEFISDTWKSVKEVLEFLGVNSNPPKSVDKVHNQFILPRGKLASKIITNPSLRKLVRNFLPRSSQLGLRYIFTRKSAQPELSSKDKKFLEEYYLEDVKKLQQFLERTLPWPLLEN